MKSIRQSLDITCQSEFAILQYNYNLLSNYVFLSTETTMEHSTNELNVLTNSIMCKVQIVQENDRKSNNISITIIRTSTFRQFIMVILANLGVIATGMALGFPAVSLNQLTDPTTVFHMTTAQSSWFGKYYLK